MSTTFYLFNPAEIAIGNNSLDISTGNYYAVLVQTLPNPSVVTVAGLNVVAGVNYSAVPLTGLVYIANQKWTFDSFRFSRAQFSTPVVGVVICKRLSALPQSTDLPIVFSALRNTFGDAYSLAAGTYAVDVDLPVTGAIERQTLFGYASGSWNGVLPYSADVFGLIGTRNNQFAYQNPCNLATVNNFVRSMVLSNSGVYTDIATATDRNMATGSGTNTNALSIVLDFWGNGTKKKYIKPGLLYLAAPVSQNAQWYEILGSNDSNVYNQPFLDSLWTQLYFGRPSNFEVDLSGGAMYLSVNSAAAYRFLKIKQRPDFSGGYNYNIAELGLYNSVVFSNSVDFA